MCYIVNNITCQAKCSSAGPRGGRGGNGRGSVGGRRMGRRRIGGREDRRGPGGRNHLNMPSAFSSVVTCQCADYQGSFSKLID